jgi:C1A family cysteine protease
MEFFYKKFMDGKENDVFSEKFVYYTTRVNIAGWPAQEDSGAYIRDTMKSMVKFGSALEPSFPYVLHGDTDCRVADVPPIECYEEAKKYQITAYANIPENDKVKCLSDLKVLLQSGYAFIGGFVCYENIFSSMGGIIPLPAGRIIGGHAVLFVGYDDAKQAFKFKNSWGDWGDNGYGYLPYYYLSSGNMFDLWTVYLQEHNDRVFGVVQPRVRSEHFKARVQEILSDFGSGKSFGDIINDLGTHPGNDNILSGDLRELGLFARRLESLISSSLRASGKIKI